MAFSWISRLFRKPSNDGDFEKILEELENSIQDKQLKLADIRHRENRAVVLFTTYSLASLLVYIVLWYFGILVRGNEDNALAQILHASPIAIGPILIIFTRRIVQAWFQRKQQGEEVELKALKIRQRDQLEKLKKLTNYNHTRDLLERYDEVVKQNAAMSHIPGTPARQGSMGPRSSANTPVSTPGKPQPQPRKAFFPAPPGPNRLQQQQMPPATPPPNNANGQQNRAPAPPQNTFTMPTPPRERGWVDRLAEALLGDNEQSPSSKYALVCSKCFTHNGLALKEEYMDIQFVCPRCGHFNPSKRATQQGGNKVVKHSSPLIREISTSSSTSRTSSMKEQEVESEAPSTEAPEEVMQEKKTMPVIRKRRSARLSAQYSDADQ